MQRTMEISNVGDNTYHNKVGNHHEYQFSLLNSNFELSE